MILRRILGEIDLKTVLPIHEGILQGGQVSVGGLSVLGSFTENEKEFSVDLVSGEYMLSE